MAHATERRTQLRGLYVFQRLPMEAACGAMHLPVGTGRRWKADAKKEGDDWDSARAANALGDESFSQVGKQLLLDYLLEHQAVVKKLRGNPDMPEEKKVQLLASLGDSFSKTMSSFRKLLPEINQHATALDALTRLATFAQRHYPHNLPGVLEMLEPFGAELAKAYG